MPQSVEIVEVGPRDGLQNEKTLVSSEDKVAFIKRAIAAGAKRIEIASFVHPKIVPQMADAEDVVKMLGEVDGVTRIGLTLNKRGALRALECGIDQFGAVCVASDGFGLKNQNQTSVETVATAKEVVKLAQAEGRSGQVTISTAFGCPFDGEVPEQRVLDIVAELAEANPTEIALADTIGVGVPSQVTSLVSQAVEMVAPIPIRVHFHNTRNMAIANVWAAIAAGAQTIDSSIGGIGGCPFAPNATGNVATEDVAYLLNQSGIENGLDLDALIETAKWMEGVLGKKVPSMLAAAGGFPSRA
ncbi:MAG: hydroxymethylglutaryl-CoA lyase [Litorimonas sp.]